VRDTVRRRLGRTGQADRTTARTDLTAPNDTHAQLTGRHRIDRRQKPAITREHTPAPSQHFNLASDLDLGRCGGKRVKLETDLVQSIDEIRIGQNWLEDVRVDRFDHIHEQRRRSCGKRWLSVTIHTH
jgi:hypothetical protein